MARVRRDTIDAILEAAQVEEVLRQFVPLEQKGKKYFCPFHEDRHPSLSITSDGKFFKCFSCDAQGGAVAFLMERQGMSYMEALRFLAQHFNIPWEEEAVHDPEAQAAQLKKESLWQVMEQAAAFYRSLLSGKEGVAARAYLESRAISPELAESFGLGYSLPGWDSLLRHAEDKGYGAELLAEAGLLLSRDEGWYDRFRGRLIFPIHDTAGRVIAFGGRGLAPDAIPKYINSPEGLIYHKSHVLYGLCQARGAIKGAGHVYLVEGYTDVLAMHKAGLPNVVASCGTALSERQVRLLKRYTDQVRLLFDGDKAGEAASLRVLDLFLAQGFSVELILLPAGDDPDSYVRIQGPEALHSYLAASRKDFLLYRLEKLLTEGGSQPEAKSRALLRWLRHLRHCAEPVRQGFYLEEAAQRTGFERNFLAAQLSLEVHPGGNQRPARPDTQPAAPARDPLMLELERGILRLLLLHGELQMGASNTLAGQIAEYLGDYAFEDPLHAQLWEAYQEAARTDQPDALESWLEEATEPMVQLVEKLKSMQLPYSPHFGKMRPHSIREGLITTEEVQRRLYWFVYRMLQWQYQEQLQLLDSSRQEEEVAASMSVLQQLKQKEKAIASALGNPIPPPAESIRASLMARSKARSDTAKEALSSPLHPSAG